MTFWHFASSNGGAEGRGVTGMYLYARFYRSVISMALVKVYFLRIPRETWVELHENKRTDWFIDHRLKIRSRGNPVTCRTNQFPASFVVAFGINGFIQIAYTQSNANAALASVVAFAFLVVRCINRP